MNPDELRAAADRIAFPAYPVTPEGRTQWDEDRYASVSAMKSLAGILERDEEVGDDEGWHIGGAWGDYGEVVVPLRILSYVIGGQLDEQVVSTDPGYALTYAEQVRRAEQAEARLADVIEYTDLTGVPEAQNHTSKGAQAVKRRVHRIAHGDTTNHEVGSQS